MQRRLLMAIVNAFKWLAQSFTNLYYSLIPQTISGKQVRNKTKISKVYGNSVVENQLAKLDRETTTVSGITLTRIDDYTFSLNGTATDDITNLSLEFSYRQVDTSHKYLISGINGGSSTTYYYSINRFADVYNNVIYSPTSNGLSRFNLTIKSGTTFNNKVFHIRFTDLTQMFPFDTPTTLTDVRVQALLNRDIGYNSGEIKSVEISEFSSIGRNIFDSSTRIIGKILNDNGVEINDANSNYFSQKIPVYPNQKIYTNFKVQRYYYYDINGNWLYRVGASEYEGVWTIPENVYFIQIQVRLSYVDLNTLYIQYGDLFYGYLPYHTPYTLPFIYQGNGVNTVHDTFEITNTEYVFTKNIGSVDLGTLDWNVPYSDTIDGTTEYYWRSAGPLANAKGYNFGVVPNGISNNYKVDSYGKIRWLNYGYTKTSKILNIYNNNYIYLYNENLDNNSATPNDLKTSLANTILYYELSTPQVIRIPKKHLGIVDLGSLDWRYSAQNDFFFALISNIKLPTTNAERVDGLYCSLYLANPNHVGTSTFTNLEMLKLDNRYLYIKNTQYNDQNVFKNAMNGIYLFYETESEVADIETKVGIEAGGTITSDSNVLPNVDVLVKCK